MASDPHIQAAAVAVHDFQVNHGPYEMEDVTLGSLHGSWACDCEAKGAVAVRAWLASVGMTERWCAQEAKEYRERYRRGHNAHDRMAEERLETLADAVRTVEQAP